MKNKLFISFITLLCIVFLGSMSYATVSSNDPTTNSGGTVSITLTSNIETQSFKISVVDSGGLTFKSVEAASPFIGTKNGSTINGISTTASKTLATYVFSAPNVENNTTYNVKFKIENLTTNETEPLSNTSKVTVKGSNPTPDPKPEETTPSTPEQKPEEKPTTPSTPSTPSKSSDTSLKSLSISPFGKINKTSSGVYDITVDNKYDKVTVTAVANSSKAKVSGNGDYDLETKTNQIKIVVTAEDGSTETHKVYIRRKTAETEQPIAPPNVIENEDKDDKKDEEVKEEEKELGLLNLVITGVQLNPSFAEDVYEYTAEFSEDTDSLEVIASANTEGATVEVAGNTNLVIGENLITIMVKSEDGKVTKTYQVTVTKNEPEIVPAVTDNTVNDNNENTILADINENQELKNQIGKIVIIAAAAIIAVILLGIIIIAYTKKKDNDSSDDSQKKTDKKKEKLGKDAFVVAVDEDESYRELEKLSEIRTKNRFENKEVTVKDNEFPNDLNEIEVSVPVLDDSDSLNGRKGRRFK